MLQNETARGAALGYLAGYVDTLGFIALFGLFTAHVTGNFVLIGRAMAMPSHDVLLKRVRRLERVGHPLVSALQFVRRRFLEQRNPRPHHLFRDVERQ